MTPIPQKLRKQIDSDPFYKTCCLYDQQGHVCEGRITLDHTFTFAGKQVQEKWAIVPICAKGHEVDDFQDAHTMNKELNRWVALNRASDAELRSISKAIPYTKEKERLNRIYGQFNHKVPNDPALYKDKPKVPVFADRSKKDCVWYPIPIKYQQVIEYIQKFNAEQKLPNLTEFQIIETALDNELKMVEFYKKQHKIS